ncbi:MAG: lysine--tRNA ligase, partial [Candidatus Bathyarchaeia archaeon]
LTYLVKVAPKGREVDFIIKKLREYGYIRDLSDNIEDLERRVQYAQNWVNDFKEISETRVELRLEEANAIRYLIQRIRAEEEAEKIQGAIFEAARQNGLEPKEFFRKLYMILLGAPSGPRLGPYIVAMGRENVIEALESALATLEG